MMNINRLPVRNLIRRSGRTAALILLAGLLSFAVFGGSIVQFSLRNGMKSLENRIGADVIVVPVSAKSKTDLDNILLQGTTGYFYMNQDLADSVAQVEGIAQCTNQIFLASLRADCCSVPVQVIGFDPETDFIVTPWIAHSYNKSLETYDVVVGSTVSADVGEDIIIYKQHCHVVARLQETGTGMDTAVYTTQETIRLLLKAAQDLGHDLKIPNGDADACVSAVYIKAKEGVDPQSIADDINVHLRKTEAVCTKSMLTGVSDSLNGVSKVIAYLIAAVWVLVLFLIIAAFSMMIRERGKEFAVLRVMGASRRMLSGIILKETLIVCLAGSVLGIALACAIAFPFSTLIETSLGLPYLMPGVGMILVTALAVMAAVIVTGSVASVRTCRKLSRVDIGSVLRGENG